MEFAFLFLGITIGAVCSWLVMNSKLKQVVHQVKNQSAVEAVEIKANLANCEQQKSHCENELAEANRALEKKKEELTGYVARQAELMTLIDQERQQADQKLEVLEKAQEKLSDAFKALSSDALRKNNESFLALAKTSLEQFQEKAKGDLDKRQDAIGKLVEPVEKSLSKVDATLKGIEEKRVEAYTGLREQVKLLTDSQKALQAETTNLVNALRKPDVRGRWGEIQLKRVVEMAGMLEHCDFYQQQSVDTGDGQLRPDLLVQLPGGKNIVVDSKVPLTAFLDAIDEVDADSRLSKMKDHARLVKKHITDLSKKSYFAQFDPSPEFVVLFLPGEIFFSTALEHDPSLIEMGVEQNVIIATPTTLIALLKAVAYGWTQERLAENAKEISELGKELYQRLSQMGAHMAKVGKGLDSATNAYNSAVGSLESRVLVSARKFEDLHVAVSGRQLDSLNPVEQTARVLQAPELHSNLEDASPDSESNGAAGNEVVGDR
ncbi:MAG: DNA recombination protein RmuC [Planctomycetota bacterium]|nr:DNA recombination protein RmuC [Planctomycetota bacterium]